ncbi:hypothetical protein MSG28_006281 [Choristoneura fumiferana]|uniref:Uncharacterized protein n=1 Tax=Choristoneura fumiferana TaxID=7141 RepID=A0ACC0JEC7_CHOFU|nr:hypothetical protein MSG28_006281 [Choristoneura fumiferana]
MRSPAPGAPTMAVELCAARGCSCTLAWRAPPAPRAVRGYVLELDDGLGGPFREVYCGRETICTVDGLHYASLYSARVKAFNGAGSDALGWAMYIDARRSWFVHGGAHAGRAARGAARGAAVGVLLDLTRGTLRFTVDDQPRCTRGARARGARGRRRRAARPHERHAAVHRRRPTPGTYSNIDARGARARGRRAGRRRRAARPHERHAAVHRRRPTPGTYSNIDARGGARRGAAVGVLLDLTRGTLRFTVDDQPRRTRGGARGPPSACCSTSREARCGSPSTTNPGTYSNIDARGRARAGGRRAGRRRRAARPHERHAAVHRRRPTPGTYSNIDARGARRAGRRAGAAVGVLLDLTRGTLRFTVDDQPQTHAGRAARGAAVGVLLDLTRGTLRFTVDDHPRRTRGARRAGGARAAVGVLLDLTRGTLRFTVDDQPQTHAGRARAGRRAGRRRRAARPHERHAAVHRRPTTPGTYSNIDARGRPRGPPSACCSTSREARCGSPSTTNPGTYSNIDARGRAARGAARGPPSACCSTSREARCGSPSTTNPGTYSNIDARRAAARGPPRRAARPREARCGSPSTTNPGTYSNIDARGARGARGGARGAVGVLLDLTRGTLRFTVDDQPQDSCEELERQIDQVCGEVARAVEARRDELVRAARASRAHAAAETRAATSQAAQRLREATALLHFSIEALKESDPAAFLQVGGILSARAQETAAALGARARRPRRPRSRLTQTPCCAPLKLQDCHRSALSFPRVLKLGKKPKLNRTNARRRKARAPGAPTMAVELCAARGCSCTLAWRAPPAPRAVRGYVLELDDGLGDPSGLEVYCGRETICTVDGLHYASLYSARVKAFNGAGSDALGWAMYIDARRSWFVHGGAHAGRAARGRRAGPPSACCSTSREARCGSPSTTNPRRTRAARAARGAAVGVLLDLTRGTLRFTVDDQPQPGLPPPPELLLQQLAID